MSEVQNYVPLIPTGLEHLLVYEQHVASELIAKVGTHHDTRDGFSALPHDTSKYPFQDVRCTSVVGSNANPANLQFYSERVYPQAETIINAFKKRPKLLNQIYDVALTGAKTGIITDHPSVISTLILGAGLATAMYEAGLFSPEDIEVVLFANAMIKYTKLKDVAPTAEVLAEIVSRTLYTHPDNTEGNEDSAIPKPVSTAINIHNLRDFIRMTKDSKPMLSILAGSGGRDFIHIDKVGRKTVHMGPMNISTSGIVSKFWALPAGLDISDEEPHQYIGEMHPPVGRRNAKQSGDAIMQEIAQGMTVTSGVQRIYHPNYASFKAVKAT